MSELPAGTVTFLFSDIEGSTRLLQRLGDRWAEVIAAHNRIMREAFAATGGGEVDRQGDAFFAVFPRARHAIAAAASAQRQLAANEWPEAVELRVRMGLHTGEPGVSDEGYLGLDVVRAARICSAAHGGQVVVSETTGALVRGDRLEGLALRDLGEHVLKDLEHPERLYQLVVPGLPSEFPALRTASLPEPDDRVPGWEGGPDELTAQALDAVRQIDLGPLMTLGPRIERKVEEALAKASPSERRKAAAEVRDAAEVMRGLRGGVTPYLGLAGLVLLGLVLGVALLLYFLVRLAL